MNTLPTEIWSQIFWHACVDTGYTGCSISETCRFFNDVGKPTKFRSVALQGLSKVISFWDSIKSLPPHHLRIENMYIRVRQYQDDDADEYSEIIHLPIDAGDSTVPAMAIIDVLTAAAPSLIYLYLCLEMNREAIFLPVKFPLLSELVIHGQYHDHDLRQIRRLPTFLNLRKLRISNPRGFGDVKALAAIPTCVPYLTHLRVDRHNSYTKTFVSTVLRVLQLSPETSASPYDDESSRLHGTADLKFPASLKRLLIHPGVALFPRCGFSAVNLQQSQMALDNIVKSDSRILVYPYDQVSDRDIPRESLKEWLDRIKGEMAYWEEK